MAAINVISRYRAVALTMKPEIMHESDSAMAMGRLINPELKGCVCRVD
jgi:hypothetical protein